MATTPCPFSWGPNVLTPVFYGRSSFRAAPDGPPVPTRVYYPTIDGTPDSAAFLVCGDYPLVLMIHGQCPGEGSHFEYWDRFCSRLARCGYVVALPSFGDTPSPWNPIDINAAKAVRTWMRTTWEHHAALTNQTAVIGHSFGGIIAGQLAFDGIATRYISLSGDWGEWSGPPDLLKELKVRSLFFWGTGDDPDAQLDHSGLWTKISAPKHRLRLPGANHYDYLQGSASRCLSSGTCPQAGTLATEVTATFLGNYLPPAKSTAIAEKIGVNLRWPEDFILTVEQEFYAGSHQMILRKRTPLDPACRVNIEWEIGTDVGSAPLP